MVLHAGLVRSLVRVLARRAEADVPAPRPRPELMRAARWRAARDGLTGQLFDPVSASLVDARTAVTGLLAELEEDLDAAGEWAEIEALVEDLFARGTSAARQRRTWLLTGDLREVAAGIVGEGAVEGM